MSLKKNTDKNIFLCLKCKKTSLRYDFKQLTCIVCASKIPIFSDIPLLVNDPDSHLLTIEKLKKEKPVWYKCKQVEEEQSPWRHHLKKRKNYVIKIIKHELKKRQLKRFPKLLDIGCGDGNHLLWLKEFGEEIFGSDYNLLRLIRAKKKLPEACLFLADILNYPVKKNSFQLIFFNHVIEHIVNDDKALNTILRILSPEGIVVLGTPNEGSWWWQLAYKLDPESQKTTDHKHFYTSDKIKQKMERAGFKIKAIEHIGWGPPHWKLDAIIRKHKIIDDTFEWLGRRLIKNQASSLYLVASK